MRVSTAGTAHTVPVLLTNAALRFKRYTLDLSSLLLDMSHDMTEKAKERLKKIGTCIFLKLREVFSVIGLFKFVEMGFLQVGHGERVLVVSLDYWM